MYTTNNRTLTRVNNNSKRQLRRLLPFGILCIVAIILTFSVRSKTHSQSHRRLAPPAGPSSGGAVPIIPCEGAPTRRRGRGSILTPPPSGAVAITPELAEFMRKSAKLLPGSLDAAKKFSDFYEILQGKIKMLKKEKEQFNEEQQKDIQAAITGISQEAKMISNLFFWNGTPQFSVDTALGKWLTKNRDQLTDAEITKCFGDFISGLQVKIDKLGEISSAQHILDIYEDAKNVARDLAEAFEGMKAEIKAHIDDGSNSPYKNVLKEYRDTGIDQTDYEAPHYYEDDEDDQKTGDDDQKETDFARKFNAARDYRKNMAFCEENISELTLLAKEISSIGIKSWSMETKNNIYMQQKSLIIKASHDGFNAEDKCKQTKTEKCACGKEYTSYYVAKGNYGHVVAHGVEGDYGHAVISQIKDIVGARSTIKKADRILIKLLKYGYDCNGMLDIFGWHDVAYTMLDHLLATHAILKAFKTKQVYYITTYQCKQCQNIVKTFTQDRTVATTDMKCKGAYKGGCGTLNSQKGVSNTEFTVDHEGPKGKTTSSGSTTMQRLTVQWDISIANRNEPAQPPATYNRNGKHCGTRPAIKQNMSRSVFKDAFEWNYLDDKDIWQATKTIILPKIDDPDYDYANKKKSTKEGTCKFERISFTKKMKELKEKKLHDIYDIIRNAGSTKDDMHINALSEIVDGAIGSQDEEEQGLRRHTSDPLMKRPVEHSRGHTRAASVNYLATQNPSFAQTVKTVRSAIIPFANEKNREHLMNKIRSDSTFKAVKGVVAANAPANKGPAPLSVDKEVFTECLKCQDVTKITPDNGYCPNCHYTTNVFPYETESERKMIAIAMQRKFILTKLTQKFLTNGTEREVMNKLLKQFFSRNEDSHTAQADYLLQSGLCKPPTVSILRQYTKEMIR